MEIWRAVWAPLLLTPFLMAAKPLARQDTFEYETKVLIKIKLEQQPTRAPTRPTNLCKPVSSGNLSFTIYKIESEAK